MDKKFRHLDLFSGIGGFALAASWVWGEQHEIVSFCEIEKFPQQVLKKHWPDVPIHDDITTINWSKLKNVDIITGGFPCQDLSCAGKRKGIFGERSGLWGEICKGIGEVRPKFAIMENVTGLLTGDRGSWFGKVLSDLASIGYDAFWHCISASAIGAQHHRDRVWIIAYPKSFHELCCSKKGEFQIQKHRRFIPKR